MYLEGLHLGVGYFWGSMCGATLRCVHEQSLHNIYSTGAAT